MQTNRSERFYMLGKACYPLQCRGHTWAGRREPKGKRVIELGGTSIKHCDDDIDYVGDAETIFRSTPSMLRGGKMRHYDPRCGIY